LSLEPVLTSATGEAVIALRADLRGQPFSAFGVELALGRPGTFLAAEPGAFGDRWILFGATEAEAGCLRLGAFSLDEFSADGMVTLALLRFRNSEGHPQLRITRAVDDLAGGGPDRLPDPGSPALERRGN